MGNSLLAVRGINHKYIVVEKGEKKADGTGKKNFDTYEPAVVMRDGVVLRSNLKGEYPKKEVKDPSNLPLNLVSSHTADLQRDITAVFERYYTGKADRTLSLIHISEPTRL